MTTHDKLICSGVHHIGVPVRSMERSLGFYRELFGINPEFVADAAGPGVERLLGVPGADLSFAFLRIGDAVVELLEYREPRGHAYDRRNCDVGAVHIAFKVPDVQATYQLLVERGAEVSGPPLEIDEGPLSGCATLYFKDPDGIPLEAFQAPAGD